MYQFIKVIAFSIFDSGNDCPESKFNRIIYILRSFFTQFIFT